MRITYSTFYKVFVLSKCNVFMLILKLYLNMVSVYIFYYFHWSAINIRPYFS